MNDTLKESDKENKPTAPVTEDIKKGGRGLVKLCTHCGKKTRMEIVKYSTKRNKFSSILIHLFSPGGVELKQRYKCPHCLHEFDDMSFSEAVIVPVILVTIVILSVIFFLVFVFFSVSK